jgi:hypothetical protein
MFVKLREDVKLILPKVSDGNATYGQHACGAKGKS